MKGTWLATPLFKKRIKHKFEFLDPFPAYVPNFVKFDPFLTCTLMKIAVLDIRILGGGGIHF